MSGAADDAPITVFLGPTLALAEARPLLDARYLPPVRLGDLYRLLPGPTRTVAIIDGVFDATTPVWHREILALLEAGVSVCGASSMGALRAAELHPYGMYGHGRVFEWYRDGIIDGDDEVALFHGPMEMGYPKLSEPLVNIRHGLGAALAAGVLDRCRHDALLDHAKSCYFGDRDIASLLAKLAADGDDPAPLGAFLARTPTDLKRDDAVSLLRAIAAGAVPAEPRPLPGWRRHGARYGTLVHGHEMCHAVARDETGAAVSVATLLQTLAERLERYADASREAAEAYLLARSLERSPAHPPVSIGSDGPAGTASERRDALAQWWHRAKVADPARWLRENALEERDWEQRALDERLIERALREDRRRDDPLRVALERSLAEGELAMPSWHGGREIGDVAARIARVSRWGESRGYRAPGQSEAARADEGNGHARGMRGACARHLWLVGEGPAAFGFAFDPLVGLFRWLQMRDRVRELLT